MEREQRIKNILKALLLSTTEPLSISELKRVLDIFGDTSLHESGPIIKSEMLEAMLLELQQELSTDSNSVYAIVRVPEGYRLVIQEPYAQAVRILRKENKPARLSQAALETLTFIAHKQPVTKAHIEEVRGVSNTDALLKKLLEYELIHCVGQADFPGKPNMYGTTSAFLELCGLQNVGELTS